MENVKKQSEILLDKEKQLRQITVDLENVIEDEYVKSIIIVYADKSTSILTDKSDDKSVRSIIDTMIKIVKTKADNASKDALEEAEKERIAEEAEKK